MVLSGSVTGFQQGDGFLEAVARWLERCRTEIVEPLASSTLPDFRRLRLAWSSWDGREARDHERQLDDRLWERVLDELRQGAVSRVAVSYQRETPDDLVRPPGSTVAVAQASLTGLELEGMPHDLGLLAPELLFEHGIDRELQRRWVELTAAAFGLVDGSGYVTHDRANLIGSPYELGEGASSVEGTKRARELLRGYYWGSFLGPGHVERLGGLAHVQQDAPAEVTLLAAEPGPRVLLQLGDDVTNVPVESLRALKRFLEPVLAPPDPEYFDPGYGIVRLAR